MSEKPIATVGAASVVRVLGMCAALLVLAHVVGVVLRFEFGLKGGFGLIPLFDLDDEKNVPTLFSTGLLLLNAGLLTLCWRSARSAGRPAAVWLFLSVVFLFLALDEFAELHERLVVPIRILFGTSGLFHFSWVIPYAVGTLLVGAAALPTLRRMRRDEAVWFVAAAAAYLTGALGVEMLAGRLWEIELERTLAYETMVIIEEGLEMTGLILFTHALLRETMINDGGALVEVVPDVRAGSSKSSR